MGTPSKALERTGDRTCARALLLRWRGGHACPGDKAVVRAVDRALAGRDSCLLHFSARLLWRKVALANELYATVVSGVRPLPPPNGPITGRVTHP